jgi:hypothetical protein
MGQRTASQLTLTTVEIRRMRLAHAAAAASRRGDASQGSQPDEEDKF